jgi:hypothetical protein
MTTLKLPSLGDMSADDRGALDRLAKRMGQNAEGLMQTGIFAVQTHWPAWLEANFEQAVASYLFPGTLPPLAKEAMHVGVSMTNHCEY